jgi:sulfite exporter TauE/SafE
MTLLAAGVTGLVFALANTAHCVGMCGAFALRAGHPPGRIGGVIAYGLGKAFTYGFLGAVAAWLGRDVLSAGASAQMTLAFAVAAVLIGAAIVRLLPARPPAGGGALAAFLAPLLRSAGTTDSWGGRWVLGALTAALPCGVVYLAALQAAASGSAIAALVLMAGFALGTMPGLGAVALLGRGVLSRVPPARMRIASGCVMLLVGLVALGRTLLPLLAEGSPRSCCH